MKPAAQRGAILRSPKHEIGDDDVGREGHGQIESGRRLAGDVHVDARELQHRRVHLPRIRVVFDEQDDRTSIGSSGIRDRHDHGKSRHTGAGRQPQVTKNCGEGRIVTEQLLG
jgi:hypothetical protein